MHDTSTGGSIYSLFGTDNFIPSTIWIDHNMVIYDKMNSAGSWSINSRIKSMLEDCGECSLDGTPIEDGGSSSQSYQGYCCEEFGGEYFENSNPQENYCVGSDASWLSLCSACTGTVDSDGDGLLDECDDCFNMSGDLNEDMLIDVLDIVSLVNIILNVTTDPSLCTSLNADFNTDGIINVQDIILVINSILGLARTADSIELQSSQVDFEIVNSDMKLTFELEELVSGIEIKFPSNSSLDIQISENDNNIFTKSNTYDGMQHYIAFSLLNNSFENNFSLVIEDGASLSLNDIDILLSSTGGIQAPISYNSMEIDSFSIENVYPNPFNPSTDITYDIQNDGYMNISIYNVLGQKVSEILDGYKSVGTYKLRWNANDLSSGIYYIQMNLNGQYESYKSILLK